MSTWGTFATWPYVPVYQTLAAIDENYSLHNTPEGERLGFGRLAYRFDNGYGVLANVQHKPGQAWHFAVVTFHGPNVWSDWDTYDTAGDIARYLGIDDYFPSLNHPDAIRAFISMVEQLPKHPLPEALRHAMWSARCKALAS